MSTKQLEHLICLSHNHIAVTKALWQYDIMWFMFFSCTLGLIWVAREQWRQRNNDSPYILDWVMKGPTVFIYVLAYPLRVWSRYAHWTILTLSVLWGLFSIWLTSAIFMNTLNYLSAIRAGIPRC